MKLKQTLAALAACLVAAGGALARMPAEINLAYVKAPFNLQCMVIKEKKLMEKAFAKDGVKIRWRTITSGAQQAQAMAGGVLFGDIIYHRGPGRKRGDVSVGVQL